MRVSLGQTIVIENTTGAGGTIAVARVARSAPDGYTIGIGQNGSHVVTGATYQRLPYDLLNDFQPLTLLTDAPFFLAARKTLPPDDLKGLIAWMKANPGKTIFGNGGNGSITHISSLLFMDLTKTTAQVVPYRGNAPAMQDLVGGQIDIMVADPVTGVPQVRGGSIKAYAVTAKSRLSTAPDIPTVDEAGLPGYQSRFGMDSGCPRARRSRSWPSSMLRWSRRSPIRQCEPSSPRLDRTSSRASGRTRRRSTLTRKPRSRNGGR